MAKPLIVDMLVGTSHQSGERVKHPFPHEAIAHAQEGIEVEPDLETLKGVLEGGITVDLLNHFRIGWIALPVEVIQFGLTVVLFSDVVYFAHNVCLYWLYHTISKNRAKRYSIESLFLVLLVTDTDDVLHTVIPHIGYRDKFAVRLLHHNPRIVALRLDKCH